MKKYLIGLLMVLSLSAYANWQTGNSLLDKMKTSKVFAFGYVAGIADENDGSYFVNIGAAIPSYVSCIPGGVTIGQASDVVEQYLIANPAIRHYSASILVSNALTATWPCKPK
jgi:hypothetical protein